VWDISGVSDKIRGGRPAIGRSIELADFIVACGLVKGAGRVRIHAAKSAYAAVCVHAPRKAEKVKAPLELV
jgi:hypothetical protein